ncbi:MAG: hypothetical protein J5I93_19920, partial [Pirellulaceae bacterium]|nr:hypothetical protein [Pirellulaceae bacterium]
MAGEAADSLAEVAVDMLRTAQAAGSLEAFLDDSLQAIAGAVAARDAGLLRAERGRWTVLASRGDRR